MKKNLKILFTTQLLVAFFLLINVAKSQAQNPIMRGYADPAMKVHKGRMYMVVGKDVGVYSKKFLIPFGQLYPLQI